MLALRTGGRKTAPRRTRQAKGHAVPGPKDRRMKQVPASRPSHVDKLAGRLRKPTPMGDVYATATRLPPASPAKSLPSCRRLPEFRFGRGSFGKLFRLSRI